MADRPKTLEIEDEIEGERTETNDYFFSKIGEPLSLLPDNTSPFDLQTPPSKPLLLSERFSLLFAAHSSGFCVAKTKDVIASAKEVKDKGNGACVQELSVVDVQIGRVSILSLSLDSSLLAAVVGPEIHCFSVDSLLNKEKKPIFSCSVESKYVKDMVWIKDTEASYIVLTDNGKLHVGTPHKPLKQVMDEVDAVERSVDGRFVAVAKNSVLSIFSSKLKEILQISLPINSWGNDGSASCTIKVDSIRWVRSDCLVVGCLKQADDCEENYFLQAIISRESKITDDSANLAAISFEDSFPGLVDDIVPSGNGPLLFMNYLEHCELAFVSNRKNTDQHIMLFAWSKENNQVCMVDIERDSWLPRVELQENGDDNLVLGLCIDRTSYHESVNIKIGPEEQKELPSHCILVCLTLEGKLVMYNFASIAESQRPRQVSYALSEDTEDIPVVEPSDLGEAPSNVEQEGSKQSALALGSTEGIFKESIPIGLDNNSVRKDLKPSDNKYFAWTPSSDENLRREPSSGNHEEKTLVYAQTHSGHSGVPHSTVDQFSLKNSHAPSFSSATEDIAGIEKSKTVRDQSLGKTTIDTGKSIVGNIGSGASQNPSALTTGSSGNLAFSGVSNAKSQFGSPSATGGNISGSGQSLVQAPADTGKSVAAKIGFGPSQSTPFPTSSSSNLGFSGMAANARSPFGTPSAIGSKLSGSGQSLEQTPAGTGKSIVSNTGSGVFKSTSTTTSVNSHLAFPDKSNARSPFGSSSAFKSSTASNTGNFFGGFNSQSADTFSSIGKPVNHSQKAVSSISETPLNFSTSKMQPQGSIASQNPIGNSRLPMKGNHITSSPLGQLNSEQKSSNQFGNVQNMASELDKLLECIEEGGGFKDVCTTAHRSSLETLEEGMKSLSDRSRVWQSFTEERLREIQLLLDKTVQVLARKTHMEGIVKQTTDRQYWDMWNRRKLSSELDLKRQNILNLNQDLTNQMIELERHFNVLELNLFGESSAVNEVSRALHHRTTPSRYIQSLHAVHSATISQLAAAQQLSESLSRQMAALNVKSPSVKKENIKKQLFDSIGLSDPGDYLNSPNGGNVIDSPSNKKPLVSCSGALLNGSMRNRLSGVSSHDPETARRRRDSLDRNWANFEAPKTTVKRMLIEKERHNVSGSRSSMHKELVSPSKLEGSVATYPKDLAVQDRNGTKNTLQKLSSETVSPSVFKWAGPNSAPSQVEVERSPGLQVLQGNSFSTIQKSSSPSPISSIFSSPSPFSDPNMIKGNNRSSTEITGTLRGQSDKSEPDSIKDSKRFGSQFGQEKLNTLKTPSQLPSSPVKSVEAQISYSKETAFTDSAGGQRSLFGSSHDAQPLPTSTSSPISVSFGSVASGSTASAQSSTRPVVDGSITSANTFKDAGNQVPKLPSSVSSVSSSSALSNSIFSKDPLVADSRSMGSFLNSAKEPMNTGPQPSAKEVGADTNLASTPLPAEKSEHSPSPSNIIGTDKSPTSTLQPQKLGPSANDGLKFEPSTSAPSAEAPKENSSGSSFTLSRTATLASYITSNAQPEKTSAAQTPPQIAPSVSATTNSATYEKNEVDAPISQEDEMEEEAPETNSNPSAEFSLGSLAGFGLGSAPTTTAPRSNPFGAPIAGSPPNTSSAVSVSVPSGELFRPASFSFQSLQAPQQTQPPSTGATFGGFGSGNLSPQQQQQPPSAGGFGQPSQIGSGQQALGSVLGSFGQSRQFGAGLPSVGFGGGSSAGGFGGASTGGGFAGISATSGGFAGIRSTSSGFGGVAAPGGGFASAATGGGGFGAAASAGGGFAAAATTGGGFGGAANTGGGFGAFSKPATGGFSGFGTGGGGSPPPSNLFTQIRK